MIQEKYSIGAEAIQKELNSFEDPSAAVFAQRFFKTGPGQYGEGDIFIGLKVPLVRKICKSYQTMTIDELEKLLESPVHEHRLAAVIIMTMQAKKGSEATRRQLFNLYLRRTDRINNWDIIDVSCREIIGGYLIHRSRKPLYVLVKSKIMWERRIAIVSTWQFIREGDLDDTFRLAERLLQDREDLMHKATGWMLREAGKRDEARLKRFLDLYAGVMPRTMLRYSLERLHPQEKIHYMSQKPIRSNMIQ